MIKKVIRLFALLLILGLGAGAWFYYKVLSPAVVATSAEAVHVAFPTGSSYAQVEAILDEAGLIPDLATFRMLAERMNYRKTNMRTGRFAIEPGMTVVDMIRHLRNGKQAPVAVVLTTEREPENVAAKAARFIEPDSTALVALMQNAAYIDSLGYNKATLMTLFIPNTYEFFWNTTPRGFMERMVKEHDAFWNKDNRKDKAAALGLTPEEVYTLASIVEKETLRNEEKKRMAGVYYNRIQTGMPLQADPTAVFASRDFNTTRVTNYHLSVDSPYNTYRYAGLPPGPIAMASIASIDAVLNLESHDYLYFCAAGDGSGLHNFAKTLAAHNQNAALYRENLRKRGLR
ncbi:MAG: endolytic transglycosylase MltG [Saprospiraceae bacterium]